MTIGTVKWFNAPRGGGFMSPRDGSKNKSCTRNLRQA